MAWTRRSGTPKVNQKTKLGLSESDTVKVESASNVKSPEVLKFTPSNQNVIQTIVEFNNGDAENFTGVTDDVIFDGTMRLKTSYSEAMTNEGVLGSGTLFSATIDRTAYKKIESMEVK